MKKSGISLLTLIITIIVIIILAGALILSISKSNTVGQANEAKFKTDIDSFKSELLTYTSKQLIDTRGGFNLKLLNADTTTNPNIIDIIRSMDGAKNKSTLYTDILEIREGKLILKDSVVDETIIGWAKELGVGTNVKIIEKVESTSTLWEFDAETKTITDYLGSDKATMTSITIPNYIDGVPVEKITGEEYSSLFSGLPYNAPLAEVIISEGIKTIGYNTFYNCTNLTNLSLPETITTIESNAFYYCSKLPNITLPDSITTIEARVFYYCSTLPSITLPESLASIDPEAFMRCSKLSSIDISNNNLTYSTEDGVLFNKDKTILVYYPEGKIDTAYIVPSSVTSIGKRAFYNNINLEDLTLQNGITSIGEYALSRCNKLTSVILPSGVTKIEMCTFWESFNLTDVTIPSTITSIEKSAFSGSGITNIDMPYGLTTIGDSAFEGTPLTSVTIPNSVTSIGFATFRYCDSLIDITIGSGITSVKSDMLEGTDSLLNIYVDAGNTSFAEVSGILFNLAQTKIVKYPTGRIDAAYIIPSTVTSIGESAFQDSKFTSVTIPHTVTYIGQSAFQSSSLTSVTIPNSVTNMGMFSFIYSRNLETIIIEEGVPQIGHYAFNNSAITTITIPSSVTWMGIHIFSGCDNLTEVIINKPKDSISGAPWSAPKTTVISWVG